MVHIREGIFNTQMVNLTQQMDGKVVLLVDQEQAVKEVQELVEHLHLEKLLRQVRVEQEEVGVNVT